MLKLYWLQKDIIMMGQQTRGVQAEFLRAVHQQQRFHAVQDITNL